MPKTTTLPWDAADHLDDQAAIVAYLNAALEDGDPALVAAALGDIAAKSTALLTIADRGIKAMEAGHYSVVEDEEGGRALRERLNKRAHDRLMSTK